MNKTQDPKLQIVMDLERERERERVEFSAKVERERAGFFGLRELGFG